MWECDWIQPAQDGAQWQTIVSTEENLRIPNEKEFLDQLSDYDVLKTEHGPWNFQ